MILTKENMMSPFLSDDIKLKYLVYYIHNNIPYISIILGGSRARGDYQINSDYDITIVLHFLLVPLYLKKIRKMESELKNVLGVDINLNIMPFIKNLFPISNPYLEKMKRDGIVLCGADIMNIVNKDEIYTVNMYWSMYHLISLMKVLLDSYSPINIICTCTACFTYSYFIMKCRIICKFIAEFNI